MNLKKVQFEDRDIQFIKDNGAEAYLVKVFSDAKIVDDKWKDYMGSVALSSFVNDNGIDSESFCKFVDHKFPKKVKKWTGRLCDSIKDGSCSWEEVVKVMDAVMSDAEKSRVIKSYSAGV